MRTGTRTKTYTRAVCAIVGILLQYSICNTTTNAGLKCCASCKPYTAYVYIQYYSAS